MDNICDTPAPTYILEQLNDVRLSMNVSWLSNIPNADSKDIEKLTMYGPLADLLLAWPKRRPPLEENMKLWKETIRADFCGMGEIYPKYLGENTIKKLDRFC